MNEFRRAANGRVEQNKPISFTFDGKTYQGFEATRSPRPCWQMVFIWSDALLNITARAGYWRQVQTKQMRWSRLIAVLGVSRPMCVRRRWNCMTG